MDSVPSALPESARWTTAAMATGPVMRSGGQTRVDEAAGRLITRSDLDREGLGKQAIDLLLNAHMLVRIRSGVYLPGDIADGLAPWEKDIVALHGHDLACRGKPVFVGASAARLWGLDVWRLGRSLHVLERGANRVNVRGPRIVCHNFGIEDHELATVRGLKTTSLERTVIDCLRTVGLTQGVVLADSALRRGADPDVLAATLDGVAGTRGTRRAARMLALADGRSESVAEGRMRMLLEHWHLPAPVLQHEVVTARHRYRLDMAWPEGGRALEVHGNGKYFQDVDTGEKLLRERKREAELAEAGIIVLNVWWEQLDDPDLRSRVERHLAPLLRPAA